MPSKIKGFLGKVRPPRVSRDLRRGREAYPMDSRLKILHQTQPKKMQVTQERKISEEEERLVPKGIVKNEVTKYQESH